MDIASQFTRESILGTFTIECFQKSEETFEKTHYPLTFTYHRAGPGERDVFIAEDVLLQEWESGLSMRKRTGNFIRPFVIWGAPGTGKTELCRVLEVNISKINEDYHPIRISKRDLAMGGILGIAQILSNRPIDIGQDLLSNWGGQTPEQLFAIALGILEREGKFSIKTREGADKAEAYTLITSQIIKNIRNRVDLLETTEDMSTIESQLEFITQRDLVEYRNENLIKKGFIITLNKDVVNKELYRKLIPLFYSVESVQRLIFDNIASINKDGKIPVLIFDDVTFLGDLVDDFISVITDISGDSGYFCDFVIGTTTAFYNARFRDVLYSTAQARINEIKLSPDTNLDANQANWLMGEEGVHHFLHFAHKYLQAARISEKNQKNAYLFIEDGYNYHPFTKTFLINLYNRVVIERIGATSKSTIVSLTPRFMIQTLRNALVQTYDVGQPPSSFIDQSLSLNSCDYFAIREEEKQKWEPFYCALWWYGNQERKEGTTVLSSALYSELLSQSQTPPQYKGIKQFELPITSISGVGEPGRDTIVPIDPSEQELKENIRRWCRGENAQISTDALKKGLNNIIKLLNANLSGSKSYTNFINRRSSRRDEIEYIQYIPAGQRECDFYIGENGIGKSLLIILPKERKDALSALVNDYPDQYVFFNVDDFYALYKIGSLNNNDPDYKKYIDNFLRLHADELSVLLEYQNILLRKELESALGTSLEAYILSAFSVVSHFYRSQCIGLRYSKSSVYPKILEMPKDIPFKSWPYDLVKTMKGKPSYDKLGDITDGLFRSAFSLRGGGMSTGVVDYPTLVHATEDMGTNPYLVVLRAQSVGDKFILKKSGKKLDELIILLKEIVRKCVNTEHQIDDTKIETIYSILQEIEESDRIIKALEELKKNLPNRLQYHTRSLTHIQNQLIGFEAHEYNAKIDQIMDYLSDGDESVEKEESYCTRLTIQAVIDAISALPAVEAAVSLNENLGHIQKEIEQEVGPEITVLRENMRKFVSFNEVI